jgi:hypothetical protein
MRSSASAIPPAAHTYQSDLETVHRIEEDEFFDLEDFTSRDFLAKVHTYQLYFNLARPNSHKDNQRQIIERLAPRSPLAARTLLASASLLGLLPQRCRGIRCGEASLRRLVL